MNTRPRYQETSHMLSSHLCNAPSMKVRGMWTGDNNQAAVGGTENTKEPKTMALAREGPVIHVPGSCHFHNGHITHVWQEPASYRLVPLMSPFSAHMLVRTWVLFPFQVFGDFPVNFLLVVSSLSSLWSGTLCMIPVLLNVLRFVLQPSVSLGTCSVSA